MTDTIDGPDTHTQDVVIERHFPVDPARVFEIVTQPEHLADWWGPEGLSLIDTMLDLSRAGPWQSTMVNADGARYKVSGRVVTVDPPRHVEFTWGWHDAHDTRGHESRVRFDVRGDGNGGTIFRLIHTALPDAESVANHTDGWTSSLRKLERKT